MNSAEALIKVAKELESQASTTMIVHGLIGAVVVGMYFVQSDAPLGFIWFFPGALIGLFLGVVLGRDKARQHRMLARMAEHQASQIQRG